MVSSAGIFLASLAYFAPTVFADCLLGLPGINAAYDYVVVGGGTSGLAIASRLAEDLSVSVAIVEAGGYYELEGTPLNIIPGFAAAAGTGTSPIDTSLIDWNFVTQPLKAAKNRVLRYARGRTLGGTSARNFMVYHRGTKGSFAQWAEITGDASWEWDKILPFFKKSSTLHAPDMSKREANTSVTYNPSAFDNTLKGPVQVSWPNYGSPLSTYMERGLEDLGIPSGQDFNSGSLNGSSWSSTTIDPLKATRSSSQTSYLDNLPKGNKVSLYTHTLAKKIQFSGTTATSVKVRTGLLEYTLTAKKEIIVSAGTFQSPQLLMVSGIGPKATLNNLGIKVIKDLPGVGQNLWDHALFGVVNRVNVITATNMLINPLAAVDALAQWTLNQEGPLTAPGFGVLAWEKLPAQVRAGLSTSTQSALGAFPDDWPEVEYLGLDGILNGWHTAADQMVMDGYNYGTIAAALVAPLSRGSVSISSNNMSDPPVINLAYLEHPADQEVAVAAVKRLRKIWAATDVAIGDEYLPGSAVQTDAEILDFIRSTVVPVWHVAGTCAMGKTTDPNAVVDSNARVIGVSRLRVVDASIFPVLPPGHPQSACYMVAEKIAAAIKNGA